MSDLKFFAALGHSNSMKLSAQRLSQIARVANQYDSSFKLKCGLEVHAQLSTRHKLFSLSRNDHDAPPNSQASFFDCGLPGAQPRLNPEAVLLALKSAVALECDIQPVSWFDRKHYFYHDQPNGYQITQYFQPFAKGGKLDISTALGAPKVITLSQIQLEQDTGKTTVVEGTHRVDYNRNNVPLIEIITNPDFETIHEVCTFSKSLQSLLRHLHICTGDLENGAMRIDVNISVNNQERVELKNMRSFKDIENSILCEYRRQIEVIKDGKKVTRETRSWNGKMTNVLRLKSASVDYRFLPDSELPLLRLSPSISSEIRKILPELPESIFMRLRDAPSNLESKYARFLVNNTHLLLYYDQVTRQMINDSPEAHESKNKLFFNTFLKLLKLTEKGALMVLKPQHFVTIVQSLINGDLTPSQAGKVIAEVFKVRPRDSDIVSIIHNGFTSESANALQSTCRAVLDSNMSVVRKIRAGNQNSIMYLVGIAMRLSQGRLNPKDLKTKLELMISENER